MKTDRLRKITMVDAESYLTAGTMNEIGNRRRHGQQDRKRKTEGGNETKKATGGGTVAENMYVNSEGVSVIRVNIFAGPR